MTNKIFPILIASLISSLLSVGGVLVFTKNNKKSSKTIPSNLKSSSIPNKNSIDPKNTNLSARKSQSTGTNQKFGPHNFANLVKKLQPTVVHVSTTSVSYSKNFYGYRVPPHKEGSLGTGIIIRSDGLIVTNYHVIKGADRITVKLASGKTYPAVLKGRDQKTDLAVIGINARNLPVAPLGDSDKTPIGAWVVAIGNPFGLSYTVTAGIISAKNRKELDLGKQGYWNLIQTDAAINPGNSGGPLINMKGKVIGINTLVDRRGTGIGYAIPSNMIKKIIPYLEKYGKVERSFLGISVQTVDEFIAQKYRFKGKGAMIIRITPKGPAEQANLKNGDIIVQFNGKKINDAEDIAWEASIAGIGKKIPMKVYRDHKYLNFTVTMAAHPDNHPKKRIFSSSKMPPLGIYVQNVSGIGLDNKVMVMRVIPGSEASKHGIKRGDIILKINSTPIENIKEYYSIIKRMPYGKKIMLLVDSPHSTRWVILSMK